MNIQSMNVATKAANCQPIRSQSFAQAAPCNYKIDETKKSDVFTHSDPYTQEQKFDLACRMAALYKMKYENLLNKTDCYA